MSKVGFWSLVVLLSVAVVLGGTISFLLWNRQDRPIEELDCAMFLAAPPMGKKVDVTGCSVDIRDVVHFTDAGGEGVSEVFGLVRPADSDGSEPARVILSSSDAQLIALAEQNLAEEANEARARRFGERYIDELFGVRRFTGTVHDGLRSTEADEIRDLFGNALSEHYVVVYDRDVDLVVLPLAVAVSFPSVPLLLFVFVVQLVWTRRTASIKSRMDASR